MDIGDVYNELTIKKLGAPAEWRWCRIERAGPDAKLVTGGVPKIYRGKPHWKKVPLERAAITDIEIAEWRNKYEAETGNCSNCYGKGKTICAVGIYETKYRKCYKCNGSGKTKR